MNNHPLRLGNFTSSEIYRLMSNDKSGKNPGKPFYEYIEECNMERRLGRSLEKEETSKPLAWGKICEEYAQSRNDLIPMEWTQRSDETRLHPGFNYWAGTADADKPDFIGEHKAPWTLKSFCQLVDPMMAHQGGDALSVMWQITESHKDGLKYYWQCASNACIYGAKYVEFFVFCPYLSEIDGDRGIKWLVNQKNGAKMSDYYFIANALPEDLPHLVDGGYYKNMNSIVFEVPQSDKDALTERVKMAGKLLEPIKQREAA